MSVHSTSVCLAADSHTDTFEEGVGWIDKKAAPHEVRDLVVDGRQEGEDPILAAYADETDGQFGGNQKMHDDVERLKQAYSPTSSQGTSHVRLLAFALLLILFFVVPWETKATIKIATMYKRLRDRMHF